MIGRRFGSTLASMAVASVAWIPANAATPMLFHRPILVVGANQSSNWSGYNQGTIERNGKLFHQVSGTWRVPRATQHRAGEAEYSSTWVGIGGGCVSADCSVTDTTLIQAGTEQDVNAAGKASYSAWYELIPAPSITISGMKVRAGDAMNVSIAESPAGSNVWTISVKNATTGRSFGLTVPYSSTHLTAEWIVETPVVIDSGGNVSIGPLPSLSRVRINNGTTNGASAGLKASEEIQLVDPGSSQALVTPSAPDSDANGFNDCTYATSCPAPKGT
jgi:peptidase A4-like protein